ncbi:MAG: nitroreductase [Sphingobacteriales bacterium]|nr:nitroreductase [Sphingobacteriales bacterium]MBI3718398.1 nitroreductase [Sphingobacteriales bacterium]
MNISPDQVNELIKNRRSTFPKQYAVDKKIDDSIIEQMLENASWAPTHKQTEPWQFTVFTGEGLKQFATYQAAMYKEKEAASFKEDKYQKMMSNPLMASHIIAIGMKRSDKVPEMEEIASVSCAVQNMYLTAEAYGVGCYWTTGGVTYYDDAKAFFGLTGNDKLLGFLYVGEIAVPSAAGKRSPISEKVTWIR